MSCPTCSATMQGLNEGWPKHFWCSRCGTLRTVQLGGPDHDEAPALIERVQSLQLKMTREVGFSEWDKLAWHKLGITEAIRLPEDRPHV